MTKTWAESNQKYLHQPNVSDEYVTGYSMEPTADICRVQLFTEWWWRSDKTVYQPDMNEQERKQQGETQNRETPMIWQEVIEGEGFKWTERMEDQVW